MNTELKALLTVLFAVTKLVEDLVKKAGVFTEVADLMPLFAGIPTVVASFGDLEAEVKALGTPANEADVLAFISSEFGLVSNDAKAAKILAAALKLVADAPDVIALVQAIQA